MDKNQLQVLRAQIWDELENTAPSLPDLTADEAVTPLGAWQLVLLAEGVVQHLQNRSASPNDLDEMFHLVGVLIDTSSCRAMATDENEEEWSHIYATAVWLLAALSAHRPSMKAIAAHCYELSQLHIVREYYEVAMVLMPEAAAAAKEILADRWSN